ncbi:MAG: SH3 domain-containing protein [Bacteroidota bacterium]
MNTPKALLLICLLMILLAGCQSSTEPSNQAEQKDQPTVEGSIKNSDTTLQEAPEPDESEVEASPGDYIFQGIIMGDNVRMRSDSTTSSKVAGELNTGDPILVIQETHNRTNVGQEDYCHKRGYHWYQVATKEKIIGWVYGQFVFEMLTADEVSSGLESPENIRPFMGGWNMHLGENEYQIQFHKSKGIGPSDHEGLTGCDDIYYPVLIDRAKRKAIFFHVGAAEYEGLAPHLHMDDQNRLYFTLNSEGGNAALNDIYLSDEAVGETLHIESYIGLQDGGGIAYLSFLVGPQKARLHSFSYDRESIYN